MASSWSKQPGNTQDTNNNMLEIEILNSLKEFIGSEPFGQYLSEYVANTQRNIDQLGLAIGAEDDERASQFSHKLKGSAGNIGALKLSDACGRIQSLVVEYESIDTIRDQFQEIRKIYEQTRDELNKYIADIEHSNLKVG